MLRQYADEAGLHQEDHQEDDQEKHQKTTRRGGVLQSQGRHWRMRGRGREGGRVRKTTVPLVAALVAVAVLVAVPAAPAVGGSFEEERTPPVYVRVAVAAQTPPGAATGELSIADVAARARPSVVDVLLDDDSGGSGVRVGAGVVTNAHVVGDARTVQLTLHDGTRAQATVVRKDMGYDLALLRTTADLPALELELVGAQRQGDTVLVMGFPDLGGTSLSRGATLTRGIISAVRTDEDTGATLIQTDAPVNSGTSGGALLNLRGHLIGILTFTLGESPGLGFAVAADTVQAFLDGQPSRIPDVRNLSGYLVPAAELGIGYEGTAEPAGPRDRRARAFADSPVGPAVVQVLADVGSAERATEEALAQAASAGEGGATEVRMAVTAGKRIFVRGGGDTQEMGVVTSKGPFVVTVFLDFAGLPDNGGRTELAVKITDLLLARLPT